jgi:peptidyl-prolyl cis-trans isomerase C
MRDPYGSVHFHGLKIDSLKEMFMQRIIRAGLVFALVFTLGGLMILAQESQKTTEPQQNPPEAPKSEAAKSGIAAKVNDHVITTEEVDFFLNRVLSRLKARNQGQEVPPERIAEVRKDLINRLITQEVLLQEAQKENVTVSDEEVNEAVTAIQNQGTDVELDKLKPLVTKNLIVDKLVQQNIISKVDISDQQAEEYYKGKEEQFKHPEQVKASHILIRVDPNAPPEKKEEAKKKINQVLNEAKSGKDFTELAKKYSEEPGAAETGGDLGYFGRGAMVPPFEEAAFKLKPGEISDIVETQFGYHIIKLTDRREAGVTPFPEVKEDIKSNLKQERIREEVTKWIEELKSKAKIEVVENPK